MLLLITKPYLFCGYPLIYNKNNVIMFIIKRKQTPPPPFFRTVFEIFDIRKFLTFTILKNVQNKVWVFSIVANRYIQMPIQIWTQCLIHFQTWTLIYIYIICYNDFFLKQNRMIDRKRSDVFGHIFIWTFFFILLLST